MGLDMEVYALPERVWLPKDILTWDELRKFRSTGITEGSTTVFEWRKHHDLNRWMQRLFESRGGDPEDFNNSATRLYKQDLVALFEWLLEDAMLEDTSYWDSWILDRLKEDVKFLAEAAYWLAAGRDIYYEPCA